MNSKQNSPMKIDTIEVIPIYGFPIVKRNDNICELLRSTLRDSSLDFVPGDILVISHTIVSVVEGSVYFLSEIIPSEKAHQIASKGDFSEKRVEIALREAAETIREEPVLVTRTKQGIITDFSGVDESNAPTGTLVALPKDPDASATRIHENISHSASFNIPVIITDTQGRPWRKGAVNLAIGMAGLSPFTNNKGKLDIHGNPLRSSLVCVADEIAASTELVMGQANEEVPITIVRGINIETRIGTAKEILRTESEDLFL
ncbi:MAG: coenzyme F420-0:L-glutamate ligase [Candidatus Thorarchaeota archaeon]